MENDKKKFKQEFKKRIYHWILRLIKMTGNLSKGSANEVIIKQIIRSSTSIMANYIEADSAASKKDFINFFTYSLKSANETKFWLTLIKDINPGCEQEIEYLTKELIEISNIIAASILTLKDKGKK